MNIIRRSAHRALVSRQGRYWVNGELFAYAGVVISPPSDKLSSTDLQYLAILAGHKSNIFEGSSGSRAVGVAASLFNQCPCPRWEGDGAKVLCYNSKKLTERNRFDSRFILNFSNFAFGIQCVDFGV